MNTAQKYAPGNPGAMTTQTSPASADNRPPQSKQIDVDREIYQAQTSLLNLVDSYILDFNASEPVEVINNLLYRWLTTPTTDLARDANKDQLHTALQLVGFLTSLYEETVRVRHFTNHATKRGVTNE